jgi:hypothetical protein
LFVTTKEFRNWHHGDELPPLVLLVSIVEVVTSPWIQEGEDSNNDDRRLLLDDSGGTEPSFRNDDGVFFIIVLNNLVRIVSTAMCTSSSI